ncbi:dihydrolipoyl dehydrogenase [Metabacillus rhizolycopersici]|uniref:Dihydrolipoyl dehydrogenase n=1 Tax=Metabacillus rhizolycopersici TaxID=2875709 RepID=A0ABS7UVQ8_9BACI|nr:dihydrolipoyl dehydrogenase [Metabacillus rhizolycopersici]MBZ5752102.1 dihydrolipoyl dehydrogenase [Metabacillus rhizolycopersici]
MTKSYEIVVIGGGPGGYVAALHAAELGKKVAVIEADLLGGTCLNRGCIPSKTLLKHAEVIEAIEEAKGWGIETGDMSFSLEKMKKRKDDVIQRLRGGIAFLLKQGKIDVYEGLGMIEEGQIIKVLTNDKEERIQAERIIIATGSSPVVPPIKGLDSVDFETSDTIFDIADIPKSVVIIGGGVIGVEFACIFASLKSEVTVIEAADRIVPSEDADASKVLTKVLKKKGIRFHTSTKVTEVQRNGTQKAVKCADGKGNELTIEADTLIVSVGRKPNLSGVQQVAIEKEGPFIKVNDKMETNLPNIYAVGDVVGGYQLAHVASAEGIVAATNAAGLEDKMEYHVVPRCIYTLPEIASVGITEEEAKKKGLSVRTERFDHTGNGKALAVGETSGFVKVVYEEKYGEIIGVTMVGPHVTEMISEASAFMYLEGTVEEVSKMIHPHPTVSESFYEAALNIVHKMRKQESLV